MGCASYYAPRNRISDIPITIKVTPTGADSNWTVDTVQWRINDTTHSLIYRGEGVRVLDFDTDMLWLVIRGIEGQSMRVELYHYGTLVQSMNMEPNRIRERTLYWYHPTNRSIHRNIEINDSFEFE